MWFLLKAVVEKLDLDSSNPENLGLSSKYFSFARTKWISLQEFLKSKIYKKLKE